MISAKKDTSLDISEETEQELRALERKYGLNLHRTWCTRLPKDLLIVRMLWIIDKVDSHCAA